ncbi:hypothetical protein BH11ACT8_BH11ACT8_16340 [soil metagenome]
MVAVAAAVLAAAQVWVAVLANRDSSRQHLADTARATADSAAAHARTVLADNQLALEIHGSLTTLEVEIAKGEAPDSEVHRDYLVALHERAAAMFQLLSDVGNVEPFLDTLVKRELDQIAGTDPQRSDRASEVIEEKRGMDRSRYTWDGEGRFTKHQVLQKIAQQVAEDHHLATVDDFTDYFGKELESAVDDPTRTFEPARLLVKVATAEESHQRVADLVGTLDLDGEEWVVRHSLGWPASDYATRTQLPVIASYVDRGYHVRPVG